MAYSFPFYKARFTSVCGPGNLHDRFLGNFDFSWTIKEGGGKKITFFPLRTENLTYFLSFTITNYFWCLSQWLSAKWSLSQHTQSFTKNIENFRHWLQVNPMNWLVKAWISPIFSVIVNYVIFCKKRSLSFQEISHKRCLFFSDLRWINCVWSIRV